MLSCFEELIGSVCDLVRVVRYVCSGSATSKIMPNPPLRGGAAARLYTPYARARRACRHSRDCSDTAALIRSENAWKLDLDHGPLEGRCDVIACDYNADHAFQTR